MAKSTQATWDYRQVLVCEQKINIGNFNLKEAWWFRDVLVHIMHKGTELMDMLSYRRSSVHYGRERGHGRKKRGECLTLFEAFTNPLKMAWKRMSVLVVGN